MGNGDVVNVFSPKKIDPEGILSGCILKIVCGVDTTLVINSNGFLYSWGNGPCLGQSGPLIVPKLLEELNSIKIVDLAHGSNHVLALTNEGHVYAWGGNLQGECGQGHTHAPVVRPRKVSGLDSINVTRISAGNSHSVALSSPINLQDEITIRISKSRPFCVDVHPEAFNRLKSYLEKSEDVLTCLKLLRSHFKLAIATKSSIGSSSENLRELLFSLLDNASISYDVRAAASLALSSGSSLLLPPLERRVPLLERVLPKSLEGWNNLSAGQKMQNEMLMNNLVNEKRAAKVVASCSFCKMFTNLLDLLCEQTKEKINGFEVLIPACAPNLLTALIKHLLALCVHTNTKQFELNELLSRYLERCCNILNLSPPADILLASPAGSLLVVVIHSLLLLQADDVKPILPDLRELLIPFDQYVEKNENVEWLLQLERSIALLVGRCLGQMLVGSNFTDCETQCTNSLNKQFLSGGLSNNSTSEKNVQGLENLYEIVLDFDMNTADSKDEERLKEPTKLVLATLIKHVSHNSKRDLDTICAAVCQTRRYLKHSDDELLKGVEKRAKFLIHDINPCKIMKTWNVEMEESLVKTPSIQLHQTLSNIGSIHSQQILTDSLKQRLNKIKWPSSEIGSQTLEIVQWLLSDVNVESLKACMVDQQTRANERHLALKHVQSLLTEHLIGSVHLHLLAGVFGLSWQMNRGNEYENNSWTKYKQVI